MSNFLRQLFAFLGYDSLTFDLDEESRGQVMRASVVPLVVVLALAVQLGLEVRYENPLFGFTDEQMPEFWRRAYAVSFTVAHFGPPLATAIIFASGIQSWTRAGGSWMVLLGYCS